MLETVSLKRKKTHYDLSGLKTRDGSVRQPLYERKRSRSIWSCSVSVNRFRVTGEFQVEVQHC